MWITLCLVTLIWLSTTQAKDVFCENLIPWCKQSGVPWTRCFEERIVNCTIGRRLHLFPNYVRVTVSSSKEAELYVQEGSDYKFHVHIPSSALQRSRGRARSTGEVQLVATVISSSLFELSPHVGGMGGIGHIPVWQNTVMGESVLAVKAGNYSVKDLLEPIKLTFKSNKQVKHGTCVFWEESGLDDGTGHWSSYGCDTSNNETEFICSCNHLSFFAVLVNPVLTVEKHTAVTLSYITYIGSALSVLFTGITLIIYICLQQRRPETSINVHMQLTGALLCLHLSFLLCSLVVQLLTENEEGWVCQVLGLFLHWSLLATFSWTALEGFHLYLLLVRVFNIYVRRYLLKLSLVGWGIPTLTVIVCGILGVYGKYSLELRDDNNRNSTAQMCWMSSQFPQRLLVSYVTTVGFPCLVILFNSCMLGVVVFKLWGLRGGSSRWKNTKEENGARAWKDAATVLGLSCVLGLPWGLISTTYISLTGIYVFTILNSLQGLFIFLWSVALTCKSRSDNNSSIRDPSSQKMMTTSFSN